MVAKDESRGVVGGEPDQRVLEILRRLERFRDVAEELVPALGRELISVWSLADVDALMSAYVVDELGPPDSLLVLDIGTFFGSSAVHFAGRPTVGRVVSIDRNPRVADEINDKSEQLGIRVPEDGLGDTRVLDVAEAVLTKFPLEGTKIELQRGFVGLPTHAIATANESSDSLERFAIPDPAAAGCERLVAFVDGLHTSEGVQSDLEAVFNAQPAAVALLDDCRHRWGLAVHQGIATFIENAPTPYHFCLLADLAPGAATTSLGIVYGERAAPAVAAALARVKDLFSAQLDPIWLLRRHEELIEIVNELRAQLAAPTRTPRLRYVVADALAESALRIPQLRRSLYNPAVGRRLDRFYTRLRRR